MTSWRLTDDRTQFTPEDIELHQEGAAHSAHREPAEKSLMTLAFVRGARLQSCQKTDSRNAAFATEAKRPRNWRPNAFLLRILNSDWSETNGSESNDSNAAQGLHRQARLHRSQRRQPSAKL